MPAPIHNQSIQRPGQSGRPPRRYIKILVVLVLLIVAGLYVSGKQSTGKPDDGEQAISSGAIANKPVSQTGNSLYDAVCNNKITTSISGNMQPKQLTEVSGIVASRRMDNAYWVHNDSGDSARIFSVSAAGKLLGIVSLSGITAIDWEDIAIGPGPQQGTSYLYLADTGDNKLDRDEVELYRLPEPNPNSGGQDSTVSGTETLHLTYPDGKAHNTEAVLIDPVSAKIYLIDKTDSEKSSIYQAPAGLADGSSTMLEKVGTIGYKLSGRSYEKITAADISPSGNTIAVRTYEHLYVYDRAAGTSVADALSGQGCMLPTFSETHGEAVTFKPSGTGLVTASEGVDQPIHSFDLK